MPRNNSLFGVFLVLAGFFLLLERLQLIDGDIFLLLLGCTFIAAYLIKGHILGFLIPGSFLTWLGLYTVAMEQTYYPEVVEYSGGLLFLTLSLAFCTILIHTLKYNEKASRFWPLYPGIGLLLFAIIIEFDFTFIPQKYLEYIVNYWPAGLILLGFIIVLTSRNNKNEEE